MASVSGNIFSFLGLKKRWPKALGAMYFTLVLTKEGTLESERTSGVSWTLFFS